MDIAPDGVADPFMQYHQPVPVGPEDPTDQRWHALMAQHEVMSAAAAVAWSALVDAYRPSPDGMIRPTPDLLQRYHSACALRAAAEAELLALLQPRVGAQS
jgi:hypothetical protein